MADHPSSADCIDSTIPVFATVRLSKEILNAFFSQANAATADHEYDDPQGTLMHTEDLDQLQPRTTAPVPGRLMQQWPFLDRSPEQIIDFAVDRLNQTYFSPTNFIILDERTADDRTCLLLSRDILDEDSKAYVRVRSDFESAIVSLMTIETGSGGTDVLDVDYEGVDGVLRIAVRDGKEER